MYWFSKPDVRLPMRAFGKSLRAIVTWTSVQRRYTIEELGFAPEKVHLVKHHVDQIFWSPRERPAEMICSVGREMRDYDTLIEALRGTCPALPHRGRPRASEPQSPRGTGGSAPKSSPPRPAPTSPSER